MIKYVPGLALILAISLPARFIQSQITVNGKEVLSAEAVATGLIFSKQAGEIATVVKLTRNLFMAPVMVILSWLCLRQPQGDGDGECGERRIGIAQVVPLFILGFLAIAILNSLGLFAPRSSWRW